MGWAGMKSLQAELESRVLALALIQVTQMWSNNRRYESFLNRSEPGELTDDWFDWFVGSWNVARNIKSGRKARVREYLNSEFRRFLSKGDAECVDDAALHIQRQGWSSRRCLLVSLVSKVGFFLRPDRFVPVDSFSVRGLNVLRTANGAGRVNRYVYKDYLNAFDELYVRFEPQLKAALNEPWVVGMADHLHCPRAALISTSMRRKLFDDYLMHAAEYRA